MIPTWSAAVGGLMLTTDLLLVSRILPGPGLSTSTLWLRSVSSTADLLSRASFRLAKL